MAGVFVEVIKDGDVVQQINLSRPATVFGRSATMLSAVNVGLLAKGSSLTLLSLILHKRKCDCFARHCAPSIKGNIEMCYMPDGKPQAKRPCTTLLTTNCRAATADVVMEHASSSRSHAALCFHGASGKVMVLDLNSAHGTFVNAQRLPPVRTVPG